MDIHQEMHIREIKQDVARIRWWVVFVGRIFVIKLVAWIIFLLLFFITGFWRLELLRQLKSYFG
jgi:hypothetical protein